MDDVRRASLRELLGLLPRARGDVSGRLRFRARPLLAFLLRVHRAQILRESRERGGLPASFLAGEDERVRQPERVDVLLERFPDGPPRRQPRDGDGRRFDDGRVGVRVSEDDVVASRAGMQQRAGARLVRGGLEPQPAREVELVRRRHRRESSVAWVSIAAASSVAACRWERRVVALRVVNGQV
eukprot:30943-Pelagococcus_subviridis.AAC.20